MKDHDLVIVAKERGSKSRVVLADDLPLDKRYAFWRDLSATDSHPSYEFAQLFISGQPTKTRVFKQTKPDQTTRPTMKTKLSALVAFAMLLFASDAMAQRYTYETILPANTATVAATAATNLSNVIIDVTKQDTVALQIEAMADAAGAYTLTLPIQRSVDRSVWAAMDPQVLAISFNGVTKQTIVTNIQTHGAGYLKIPYATNATASIAVTNLVLKRAIKIP